MFEDVKIKRKKVKHIGPCNLAMELWLTVLSSFPRDLRPARVLRNVPSRFRASGKKKKEKERGVGTRIFETIVASWQECHLTQS